MGAFDWIANLASQAEITGKAVVSAVAFFVAVWLCHKGGWALARVIISVVTIVVGLAALWNLNLFAKKVEVDLNGGPSVVVMAPQSVDQRAL